MNTAPVMGRGAGNNVGNPGCLGRGNAHEGRCGMGKASSRHIAPCHVHRDQFLSGNNTGMQFRFKFKHALPLLFSKSENLIVGELNIVFSSLVQTRRRLGDIILGDDEITGPVVQLLSILFYCRFTVFPDIIQHVHNDLTGFTFHRFQRFWLPF
jgi:hypothetical protein